MKKTKEITIKDFELGTIILKPNTDYNKVNKVIKKRVKKIDEIKKPVKEPE